GQRGEAAFLRVGGHAGELQQLESDPGVQRRLRDGDAAALCSVDPILAERFEERIHEPAIARKPRLGLPDDPDYVPAWAAARLYRGGRSQPERRPGVHV